MIDIEEKHLAIARKHAAWLVRKWAMPHDEALSCAYFALVDAAHKYRAEGGAAFETYLHSKIYYQALYDWRKVNRQQYGRKYFPVYFTELHDVYTEPSFAESRVILKDSLRDLFSNLNPKIKRSRGTRAGPKLRKEVYERFLAGESIWEIVETTGRTYQVIAKLIGELRKWHDRVTSELSKA